MIRSSKILKCESAKVIIALLFVVQASACFSQIAQLKWDTQLDRPVDHPLIIYRGETLDLLPRLVQGTDPVAITNQALYFRYREPSLIASNLYREVAITTNAAPGTLQFTWTPELDILSPTYDYEFVVGSNPRVHGRITMRGTISHMASTNAPPPSTRWITDLDLAAALAPLATPATRITSNDQIAQLTVNATNAMLTTTAYYKIEFDQNATFDGFLRSLPPSPIIIPMSTTSNLTHYVITDDYGVPWVFQLNSAGAQYSFVSVDGTQYWYSTLSPTTWPDYLYPHNGASGQMLVYLIQPSTQPLASELFVVRGYVPFYGASQSLNLGPHGLSAAALSVSGSAYFGQAPRGQTPTLPQHLATKNYIDTALVNYVSASALEKKINIVNGTATNLTIKSWLDVIGDVTIDDNLLVHGTATGQSPTLPQHFATKGYVDSLPKGPTNSVVDWQTFSSASATPTLTVTGHQPIRATLTGGDVTLTVTGLDSPLPVYVTIQGADSLTIASAQWVGGAFYDTASVNHYIVWTAGGALFCQPVATTEVQ